MFTKIDHNTGETTEHATLDDALNAQAALAKKEIARSQTPFYSIFDEAKPVLRVYGGKELPLENAADPTKLADAYAALQNRVDNLEAQNAAAHQDFENRLDALEHKRKS